MRGRKASRIATDKELLAMNYGLIKLDKATLLTLYWLFWALSLAELLIQLLRLGRLRELHHGYYGAVLAVLPWWPLRILGMYLLLDDVWQHWVEALDIEDGRVPRPDFSPVHRLYLWLYRKLPGG